MDHPSELWADIRVTGRVETFLRDGLPLKRDIRFEGLKLNSLEDYRKCFIWEYCRTRIFKGENLESNKDFFPFYVTTFPEKAYLDDSHSNEIRDKWELLQIDVCTHEHNDNLLIESLGTTEEINVSLKTFNIDESIKIPAEKVPITLHINPNWSRSKMKRLFCEQIEAIAHSIGSRKKDFEELGHDFIDPHQKHEMRTLKSDLKLLGHYRLSECVNLSDPNFRDFYGLGKLKSERKFRELCFKRLKHLPLEKIY